MQQNSSSSKSGSSASSNSLRGKRAHARNKKRDVQSAQHMGSKIQASRLCAKQDHNNDDDDNLDDFSGYEIGNDNNLLVSSKKQSPGTKKRNSSSSEDLKSPEKSELKKRRKPIIDTDYDGDEDSSLDDQEVQDYYTKRFAPTMSDLEDPLSDKSEKIDCNSEPDNAQHLTEGVENVLLDDEELPDEHLLYTKGKRANTQGNQIEINPGRRLIVSNSVGLPAHEPSLISANNWDEGIVQPYKAAQNSPSFSCNQPAQSKSQSTFFTTPGSNLNQESDVTNLDTDDTTKATSSVLPPYPTELIWGPNVHPPSKHGERIIPLLAPTFDNFSKFSGSIYDGQQPGYSFISNMDAKTMPLDSFSKGITQHQQSDSFRGITSYIPDENNYLESMEQLNQKILSFDRFLQTLDRRKIETLEHISESDTHKSLLPLFQNSIFRVAWIIAQVTFNKREKDSFTEWKKYGKVPKFKPSQILSDAAIQVKLENERDTKSLSKLDNIKWLQRRALSLMYQDIQFTLSDVRQWNRSSYNEHGDVLNAIVKVLNCYEDLVETDSDSEQEDARWLDRDMNPKEYYTKNDVPYTVGRRTFNEVIGYYKSVMRTRCAQQKMYICKRHNEAVKNNQEISKRVLGGL